MRLQYISNITESGATAYKWMNDEAYRILNGDSDEDRCFSRFSATRLFTKLFSSYSFKNLSTLYRTFPSIW
jgi:hypothetical protein